MKFLRRILGIFVMIAGILGLVLSLAGMAIVWVVKPTVSTYASTTIDTLSKGVGTSKSVMVTTAEALGATIDSVDALSTMLGTTATTVEDVKPVLDEVDSILSVTLPLHWKPPHLALYLGAAQVLESTISRWTPSVLC